MSFLSTAGKFRSVLLSKRSSIIDDFHRHSLNIIWTIFCQHIFVQLYIYIQSFDCYNLPICTIIVSGNQTTWQAFSQIFVWPVYGGIFGQARSICKFIQNILLRNEEDYRQSYWGECLSFKQSFDNQ